MQLEEFIHQSLTQIVSGIVKAQAEVKQAGARINPNISSSSNIKAPVIDNKESGGLNVVQTIEFDVAVTVTEGSEDKVGGGLKIAALGIGGETKAESKNSSVSRIKFNIPMTFPVSSEKIEPLKMTKGSIRIT